MVPNLIWTRGYFGPQEICSPRNLGPEKCCKMIFMLEPNFLGPNFLGPNFLGPNFLGIKFLVDQKSEAQMRSGTISVIDFFVCRNLANIVVI